MPDRELPSEGADRPEDEKEASFGESEVVDQWQHSEANLAGEVIHQSVSFRQAPYPTPQDLREYEDIHPGFTDRVLSLTERETDHRIQQERFQDSATIHLARRGQTYAFVIVMTLALGGIAAILTGHSLAGFAGLVVAAATLAGAFLGPNLLSEGSDSSVAKAPGGGIEPSSGSAHDNYQDGA